MSVQHHSILAVGFSHQTAPVEMREQFAHGLRVEPDGVLIETAVLSTCNRLEVYALAADRELGWQALEGYFAGASEHIYRLSGAEAIDHLMRVACGLESQILGETQILGQVGDVLDEADSAGSVLSHLFARAIHAGKRARTETGISRHTTSISHAAAKLAQSRLGDLEHRRVLIVGAGEMAALSARAMQMRGAAQITIINRTFSRAQVLAESVNGQACEWAHLREAIGNADVVVSATGASEPVIYAYHFDSKHHPRLLIDIALPRDADPAGCLPPELAYFNIDDLQAALDENHAERQAAIPQVETIIEQEQGAFLDWLHSREVVPVISDLYRHALSVVDAEIERALNKLDTLTPQEQKIVSQLGYRIANKLLHEPTVRLKAAASEGSGTSYADLVRDLFALEAQDAQGAGTFE